MAATRELSVTYGALTIGGAAGPGTTLLTGWVRVTRVSPLESRVSIEFVLVAASEADFAAATTALETAIRTPREKLTVSLGAETLWEWDATVPTGYNQEAQLEKPGHPEFDSGRSKYYTATWRVDDTAAVYGQDGRVNSSISLSTNPSCRGTIFVSGEWRAQDGTAGGGTATSARSVYDANKDAYFTAVKAKFAPDTYEGPLNEVAQENETDTIVTFSAEFRELIFDQAVGVRDNPAIQGDSLEIAIESAYPGDSPGVTVGRPQYANITYSTNVCKDTAKGGTQAIVDLYTGTIRPHILATLDAKFATRQRAIENEVARYNFTDNLIAVSMRVLLIPGASCLSYERTTNISVDFGWVLVPIWDGEAFTWYIYPSKVTRLRETSERKRCLGRRGRFGGRPGVSISSGPTIGVTISGGGGDEVDGAGVVG